MTANTTNGLPYPTGTDPVADLDSIVQSLAEALDTKALASWTAFTPTWIGSGSNPAVGGAGGHTVAGRYRIQGHTVDCRVKITVGTTGLGSGNYSIGSLPAAIQALASWVDCAVGSVVLWDTSAGAVNGRFGASLYLQAVDTLRVALGGSAGGGWGGASPFTPANGDILTFMGRWEI